MIDVLGLTVHLYGLLIGLGVWVGLELSQRIYPKFKKEIEDAFFWALIPGLLGARLYHVIDFWDRYYRDSLWKIFAFWEGGLGIWGAIAGVVIGLYIYSMVRKINMWSLLGSFAVGAPVAQAIGRLGNFVNGELYGKNGEPLFAYESILNLILFVILWNAAKRTRRGGNLFGIYLAGYGLIRVLLEGMRPNEIIWRVGEIPVAIIFGCLAIAIGAWIASGRARDSQ